MSGIDAGVGAASDSRPGAAADATGNDQVGGTRAGGGSCGVTAAGGERTGLAAALALVLSFLLMARARRA